MSAIIYTDGGARNNPGPAGIGALILEDKKKIVEISEYIGKQTNNFAEYTAVIRALEYCVDHKILSVIIRADSKLVVEQCEGRWKVKEPTLKPLFEKVLSLAKNFKRISFVHIPREENSEADRLVNEAIEKGVRNL